MDQEIDWEQGYELLDKELRQAVRESEVHRRSVDVLVRIFRQGGGEAWVLVHVEIQAQVDPEFAQQMFVYHYCIYDRYRRPVVSMAVLGDPRPDWRPDVFESNLWGCHSFLRFPVVKLLDYEESLNNLEQSSNPFAVLVAAHLHAQKAPKGSPGRLQSKLNLVRTLYERGLSRDDVVELFRLVDWMMALSKGDTLRFWQEVTRYEQEKKMPYVTSGEQIGIEKGQQDSLLAILETRFHSVPESLCKQIRNLHDQDTLGTLVRMAVTVESLEPFQRALPQAQ